MKIKSSTGKVHQVITGYGNRYTSCGQYIPYLEIAERVNDSSVVTCKTCRKAMGLNPLPKFVPTPSTTVVEEEISISIDLGLPQLPKTPERESRPLWDNPGMF